MPSTFDANLHHAVHFYNTLLAINSGYLKGEGSSLDALRQFNLDWENIRKGQAWSAKHIDSHQLAAHVCRRIAALEILDLRQSFNERTQWLKAGIDASEVLKDISGKADMLSKLGVVQAKKGNLNQAIKHYENALRIYTETADRLGESNQLGNLGLAYAAKGHLTKAIQYYEKALVIDKELQDKRGESTDLGNLGNAYYYLGDYDKAFSHNQKHLKIAREIGDLQGEGEALGSLGVIYDALGNHQHALNYHQKYLETAETIGDQRGQATARGNIGNSLEKMGEHDLALQHYSQQLELAQNIQDIRREASALGGIGNIHRKKGNILKAKNLYQQQLDISYRTGDHHLIGRSLYNLALCLHQDRETREAISLIEQALESLKYVEGTIKHVLSEKLKKWKEELITKQEA